KRVEVIMALLVFLRHPLLLATVLLPIGIAWFGLGGHYGVVDLFWPEEWWRQGIVGIGAGVLLFQACLVAFLLARPTAPTAPVGPVPGFGWLGWVVPGDPGQSPPQWPWSGFHRFLAFTWVPLLVLLALASVQDLAHRWALPLGLLASVVVVRVEVGWARLWSNWLGGAIGPAVQRHRGRWHLGVALLFFALVWGLPLLIRWTDTGPEEPALSGE